VLVRAEAERLAARLDEACRLRSNSAQLRDFLEAVDQVLDRWIEYKTAQHRKERAVRDSRCGKATQP
jgi:2-keto-4-pentenoate hydratase